MRGKKHNRGKSLIPASHKFHRFPKNKALRRKPRRSKRYS